MDHGRPGLISKGKAQGVTPSQIGSRVSLDGAIMAGSEKTARLQLEVDSRDIADFFDPDKTYTVTFTED